MIEIAHVSKSFRPKVALSNVSFNIKKGTITGLLGPNGAGKTTLIRLMNLMIIPDDGFIKFEGQLLKENHLKEIGYLPEERGLYKELSVKQQLLFFAKLRGLTSEEAERGALYWIERLEMSEWSHKKTEALSKGMAQKVQFAVAVVHDPKFLILDEPFTGFDPVNIDLIKQLLFEFRDAGKTILLSTHNMQRVQDICSHIILVNKGQLIANDAINDLLDKFERKHFMVAYRGTSIGFANALWTDFELVEQTERSDGVVEAHLLKRGAKSVDDLINNLKGHVSIESIQRAPINMEEVFLKLIANTTEL